MASDHSCKGALFSRSARVALCGPSAPSGRGEGKKRPLIIATRRVDILKGSKIVAIGCSTEFDEPLAPSEVRLPYDPEGNTVTGLREATVAVCDWIEEFSPGSEFETGGMVPGALHAPHL